MEAVKQDIIEDSESDNEEIFFGPLTKREVISKLKYNNLCTDEILKPLQKYQDSDVLDDSVIKFYYEDIFPKGNSDEDSWTSIITDSSVNVSSDRIVEDSFNIEESTAPIILNKDSIDLTDRKSLTESQLFKKYVNSESCQLSTKNKSVFEHEEPINEQIYNASLNIQYLSLDDQILINSTPENSATVSLNFTAEKLKSLSSKSASVKCETVSSNSTSEKSISLNCTHQPESFTSLNSTPEKSDTNDHSSFNCTLDEMEMFMKFGENYMNQSKDLSHSIKTESKKENYSSIDQVNQVQIKMSSTEKRKKNNKLIPRQLHTPKQHCYDYESSSPFTLPNRTIFKKSPAPDYRNIISPVAMYIKSTPKVPLVQNVLKKTVHAPTFREPHTNLEACTGPMETEVAVELPTRSYRPATRAMLLSRQCEPTLPGSLRRLIHGPLLPEVIRHVGRVAIVSDTCELVTPTTSPAQDLTMLSASDSEGDVSVYISTNAARTNRLQHTYKKENSPFK